MSSLQVYDKGNTAVEEVSIAYAGPILYASGDNELAGPASHHLKKSTPHGFQISV